MRALRLLPGLAAAAALVFAVSCMRDRVVSPDAPLDAVLAVDRPTVQLFRFARGRLVVADTVRISNNGDGALGPVQRLGGIDYQAGRTGWLETRVVNVDEDHALLILQPTYAEEEQDQPDRAQVVLRGEGAAEYKVVTVYARTLRGASFEFSVSPATFTSMPGEPPPGSQTLIVRNGGNGTLQIRPPTVRYDGGTSGWLSVARSGGTETAPAFRLEADPAGLSAGLHLAHLRFESNPAEATRALPAEVDVQLSVGAPRLGVSTPRLAFSLVYGSPSPAAQLVTLSNSGAGAFDALGKLATGAITYGPGASGWLRATLDSGRVTVRVEPAGIGPGVYSADLVLRSDAGGEQSVQVTLRVEAPVLTLSSRSVSFGFLQGADAPAAQTLRVTNTGAGTAASLGEISVGSFVPEAQWVSASVNGLEVTISPTVAAAWLPVGTYTARLPVSSTWGGTDTLTVTLGVARGADSPVLVLSASEVTFSAVRGEAAVEPQVVRATNSGGGRLGTLSVTEISYPAAGGWLSAAVTDTTVILSVKPGALANGTYEARVRVASQGGGEGQIRVRLTITSPILTVSASSVSFSRQVGSAAGATRSVTFSNTGPGSLASLGTVTVGDISYAKGSGWLTASLSGATLTLTLASVPGSVGTYGASVPLSSTNGGSTTIQVTLTVSAAPTPPSLVVSPATVYLHALVGGANPGPQTVAVSNGGGGSLGVVTAAVVSTPWLSASVSGSDVTLTASTGTLPASTYNGVVRVTTENAGSVDVAVVLVVGAPRLTLSSRSASFSAVQGGTASPATASVTLANTGGGDFAALGAITLGTVTYGGAESPWLSAALTGGNSVDLGVTPGSLAVGTYTATVPVSSVQGGSDAIQVTLTISPQPAAPVLLASPSSLNFTAEAGKGNPPTQTVSITNAGGGAVTQLGTISLGTIQYSSGTGWLSRALNGHDVDVTVTTGSLAAGSYSASFTVSAATGGTQTVNVEFQVFDAAAPPDLELATTQVAFTGVAGGASPAARIVPLYNAGTGKLGSITIGAITWGANGSDWLAVTPANDKVTLFPSVTGLPAGSYTATVPVNSENGGSESLTVTLTLGEPRLGVTPAVVHFAAVAAGADPAGQSVTVSNIGAGTFPDLGTVSLGTVTYSAGASGWLTPSLSGSSIALAVTTGTLTAGSYSASFMVRSTAADSATVTVQFDVAAADAQPVLALGATQVQFAAVLGAGDPPSSVISIFNSGTGSLGAISLGTIGYGAGASGWLAASSVSSTQLTLAPAVTGLAAGTYTADVPVSSVNGGDVTVAVTLTIGAPQLALSASTLSFAGTTKGANPDAQIVQLSNSGAGTLANLGAITIGSVAYDNGSGWLTLSLDAQLRLSVSVAVGSLTPATYTAHFDLTSEHGGSRTVNVAFELVLSAAPPVLALGSTALEFSGVVGTSPGARSVAVLNAGTGNLGTIGVGTITYGGLEAPWLSASAAPSGSSVTITPSTASLAAGTYTATVPVTSQNGGNTALAVTLQMGQPQLTLSARSASFAAAAGGSDPSAQTVQVSNSGAGTYQQLGTVSVGTISYQGGTGWLSASLNASGVLTMQPAISGLAAGTYQATVPVNSPAGNDQVVVSLTVVEGAAFPVLALGASSVGFVAVKGAPAPAAATVTLSNAGGGSLGALGTLSAEVSYTSGSNWLTASDPTGGTLTLTVSPPSQPGTYEATVTVKSQNGGDVDVAVNLRVVQPVLTASALAVSFTAVAGGAAPAGESITLSNSGGGTLAELGAVTVQSVSYGAGASGWLSSPQSGAALSGAGVTFTANPGTIVPGTYTATVVIASVYGGSETVEVTLSIVRPNDPPRLVLSASSQRFGALLGGTDPEPQSVQLSNGGGGTLGSLSLGTPTYGPGASGWLTATLLQNVLTVSVRSSTLPRGTYTATLPVISSAGGTVQMDVTLLVGSPRLTLTPASVTLADTLKGTNPAPVTVSVANTGGGNMASLGIVELQPVSYLGTVSGWLTAELQGGTLTLSARTGTLAVRQAPYEARVHVKSEFGGDDSVAVAFTIMPGNIPPRLALSIDTLRFASLAGQTDPAPQAVTAFNAGGGVLGAVSVKSVTYQGAAGWLQTQVNGQVLTLIPATAGLSAGVYRASVLLTSAGGGDAPLQVLLDLGSPVLRLSTRTITFSDTLGSRDPLRAQVFMSNAGSGIRSDLGRIDVGPIGYSGPGTNWLRTTPAVGQTVESFTANIETMAADVPEGTSIARVPFRSQYGGADTLVVSLTARRPDRSFDLPTIQLVRTATGGAQVLPGDSAVVTAPAHSQSQVALRVGIRNAADTRLTLSGLRVGMPTYTGSKSGWISGAFLDKTSATLSSPAELFVAIEPATLDPGRYEAQLVVRSETAGLAQVAPVTLRVVLLVQ